MYFQLFDNNFNPIIEAASVNDNGNQQAGDNWAPLIYSKGDGYIYYSYTDQPGYGEIFLHKFDAAGNELWPEPTIIGDGVPFGADDIAHKIVLTNDG